MIEPDAMARCFRGCGRWLPIGGPEVCAACEAATQTGLHCEGPMCPAFGPFAYQPARTAYHWDGTGENPNKGAVLCPACADEYHDYWDEMWEQARPQL